MTNHPCFYRKIGTCPYVTFGFSGYVNKNMVNSRQIQRSKLASVLSIKRGRGLNNAFDIYIKRIF